MKFKIFIITIFCFMNYQAQTKHKNINNEIRNGNFAKTDKMIEEIIGKKSISEEEKTSLLFEIERHNRIRKDFKLKADDVLKYISKYIPEVNLKMLSAWEKEGSLEYKIIDGEKFYFNRSPANLFRIDKKLKAIKNKTIGSNKTGLDTLLQKLVPQIITDITNNKRKYGTEEKIKLKYTITVPPNTVPLGKVIKCWMPYPQNVKQREKIILFNCKDEYLIAGNNALQRSVYLEKYTKQNEPTVFEYQLTIANRAVNFDINPNSVKPYIENEKYKKYTSQRKPHIIFTDKIKKLSKEIIGNEENPYLKAKRIFTWISQNIPWASAREYSTITNISDYCITNKHGDCGIKTLLFITLARYNGIPAKWQSGWMLHPGEVNLHDWAEIYFEGYGWVPVDQSFGLINSENEKVKYFYLGGIDQYRLIVNDDFGSPLYPKKKFFRSETVDFQRGELEWENGNLYFDKWNYNMEVEYEK